jgi:hypothetical protein
LSTSHNLRPAAAPILLSGEGVRNEVRQQVLPLRSREATDEFDLSTSNNMMAPSVQILLSVLY